MKTLIVFSGNQGCTKTIAEKMREDLGDEVILVNLRKEPNPPVEAFQRIIVGDTVRAGQIQKRVKTFCLKNLDTLLKKEIGLFICSMEEGSEAKKLLVEAYPEKLYNTAKSTALFTSGLDFSRMNFLEKMLARKVKRLKPNPVKVDDQAVQKFSRRMDRIFNPFLFIA